MPDMSSRGTKRTYDELRQELAQQDEEINILHKKQRKLTKELATYPEEQKRIDDILAKERADDRAYKRSIIDKTLPSKIAVALLDEPGRKSFPDYGSLVSISVDRTLIEIDRLSKADAVEVLIQFEKGSHFHGVIFPETRTTIPSDLCGLDAYDDLDSDESDAEDNEFYTTLDRWERALKYHDNNPVIALFALLARGVIELDGTDKEIIENDSQLETLNKIWTRVYYVPNMRANEPKDDEEENENEEKIVD